jgi:hypothetical protein
MTPARCGCPGRVRWFPPNQNNGRPTSRSFPSDAALRLPWFRAGLILLSAPDCPYNTNNNPHRILHSTDKSLLLLASPSCLLHHHQTSYPRASASRSVHPLIHADHQWLGTSTSSLIAACPISATTTTHKRPSIRSYTSRKPALAVTTVAALELYYHYAHCSTVG